jgi:hypothetical protein
MVRSLKGGYSKTVANFAENTIIVDSEHVADDERRSACVTLTHPRDGRNHSAASSPTDAALQSLDVQFISRIL